MSEVEATVWIQGPDWRAHKFTDIPVVPRVGEVFRLYGLGDGIVANVTWQLPSTGLEVDIDVICKDRLSEQSVGMMVAGAWEIDL